MGSTADGTGGASVRLDGTGGAMHDGAVTTIALVTGVPDGGPSESFSNEDGPLPW